MSGQRALDTIERWFASREPPPLVHVELEFRGHLPPTVLVDRLRRAVAVQPLLTARLEVDVDSEELVWTNTGAPVPLVFHAAAHGADLGVCRAELLSQPRAVWVVAPVRFLHFRGATGDTLVAVAHHAATDATGLVGLIRYLASGDSNHRRSLETVDVSREAGRLDDTQLAQVRSRSRVRSDRFPIPHEGGLHVANTDIGEMRGQVDIRAISLAAIRALELNCAPSCGSLGVLVAVNLRGVAARATGFGNHSIAFPVLLASTDRATRSDFHRAVTDQVTRLGRRSAGRALAHDINRRSIVPPYVQAAMTQPIVLSSLGPVALPSFAGVTVRRVWGTPPPTPNGVGIGLARVGDALTVGTRTLLGETTGNLVALSFADALQTFAGDAR